jgi:hypothetical protein
VSVKDAQVVTLIEETQIRAERSPRRTSVESRCPNSAFPWGNHLTTRIRGFRDDDQGEAEHFHEEVAWVRGKGPAGRDLLGHMA